MARPARAIVASLAFTVMAVVMAWPAPASAQGLFDFFFGSFHRQSDAPSLPWRSQAYADPAAAPAIATAPPAAVGRSEAFCVRLCDGRFFPIQRPVAATPVQLCSALCPASKTKVFSGGEINDAIATDGTRYADLANAFVYRERLVPDCTCNGKDAFGLARLDVNTDPTLQPGDMVATADGLKRFKGTKTKHGAQTAQFTPVDKVAFAPARKPAPARATAAR